MLRHIVYGDAEYPLRTRAEAKNHSSVLHIYGKIDTSYGKIDAKRQQHGSLIFGMIRVVVTQTPRLHGMALWPTLTQTCLKVRNNMFETCHEDSMII